MNLQDGAKVNQLHIGIFGKRNSGKSTLINALTGHNTAKVSAIAGTTTDPVYKAIEIQGIGSCVLIDTAGFDDMNYIGQMKIEKMKIAIQRTDIALIVCSEEDITQELEWANEFMSHKASVIMVINKIDQIRNTDKIRNKIYEALKQESIKISAISKLGIEMVKEEIIRNIPEDFEAKRMIGDLAGEGDPVLLVFDEEYQGPRGHLELMHIQVLRVLLDRKCIITSCTANQLGATLSAFTNKPKLIIADQKVESRVEELKSESSVLIKFSFS